MSISTAVLAIIEGGYQIMFEDDEEEDANVLEKIDGFAEETVPRFANHQFRHHFRMSPTTFEDLLTKIYAVSVNRLEAAGRPEILLEKQAMMAIWSLSNIESFRSVADPFGIAKSTCWDILYRTCRKFSRINSTHKIICWPSRERAHAIMQAFQEINGFEGVIGCIDGSHIKILPPKEQPNSYCNRKRFHSVLLSQIRVCIENSLALLKGRFRRLKFMETMRLDLICLLIVSACILDNICIFNGDEPNDLIDLQQELEEERGQNPENDDIPYNMRGNQLAVAKRLRIMNQLQIN